MTEASSEAASTTTTGAELAGVTLADAGVAIARAAADNAMAPAVS